jgi:ABC-type molybdate transport system permease subunit
MKNKKYYITKSIASLLIITLVVLAFVIGYLLGVFVGTYGVINKLSNIFYGSNIEVNFNETELINQFNKTVIPEIERFKDMDKIICPNCK